MDTRIVLIGGVCFSIGIALLFLAWSLSFPGYAIWLVLLGLLISGIGFIISFYGATADLVKPEWVYHEISGYQKLIVKILAYLGLALGLLVVLLVIATLAMLLIGYL